MYVSSLLYSTIEEMKFCREFNDGTDGFLSTTMPTWRATAATAAAAATATTAASRRRARRAILFDGNSILHGAYHGTPPLSNARGEPVHAVFTALRSIVSWLGGGGGGNGTGEVSDRRHHPWSDYDLAAVCWDRREPTFRSAIVPEYKAQRAPSPEDLRPQFGMARDAISRLGVCQFDAAGFEADDLLATLAVRLSAGGTPVTVVSSDKDLLQLVREDREGEDGGGEEEEEGELGARHTFGAVALAHPFKRTVRGVAEVERAYGVRPDQLPGLFALVGDAADNVKGVKGVGVKLGGRLMQEYGDVREIARAARGLAKGVAGMTRKEKMALGFDAKVLRGLTLVKAHLERCQSGGGGGGEAAAARDLAPGGKQQEGAFVSLDDLETVHRMVLDAPLRRIIAEEGEEANADAEGELGVVLNVGPGSPEEDGSVTERALAVPRVPSSAFAEMLDAHGFASIFKMFPRGVVEPPALARSCGEDPVGVKEGREDEVLESVASTAVAGSQVGGGDSCPENAGSRSRAENKEDCKDEVWMS